MNLEIFEQRRSALKRSLGEKGFPAMLVSHAANRYYLSGFELFDGQCNETSGWLVITADGDDYLLTDPRFEEEAKRHWDERNLCIYTATKHATVCEFLVGKGIRKLAFESRAMSLFDYEALTGQLELVSSKNLVEDLRLIKDEEEIRLMAASCVLNEKLMEYIPSQLVPGRTEAEIAWEVEKFFRENGAEGMSFSSIVGVGPNAALPHAIPGETRIREGELVLIDTGCRLNDYCSDQTRAFWVGDKPSDRFLKVREQVQAAQKAAIDIIRPGLALADAHNAARKVFEDAGVEEYFTHSLGHGIGLETHEPPSVNPRTEGELKAGMIVTVEPGLYYPDWGGIRWEHEVLVTEDGCRVL